MGIFTAMTTKFPGGQLPNVVDKIFTALIVFLFIALIKKSNILLGRLSIEKRNNVLMAIVLPLGTLISGILFLGTAQIIVGLPASFSILFLTVVVPSVALNTVIGLVLYRIVEKSLRRASYSIRG